jgi:cytochrome c-type biogenesis protein CcmF
MPAALKKVVTADGAFWAGQLTHAGVVLAAIGIAFAANLGSHAEADLSPGESALFAGYTITYESPFQRTPPGRTIVGARLTITRGDDLVGMAEPSVNFFGSQSGVGTPDVVHLRSGDLYFTLRDLPGDRGAITVTFDTSPMIWILWLGGATAVIGGVLAMMARRRKTTAATDRETAHV